MMPTRLFNSLQTLQTLLPIMSLCMPDCHIIKFKLLFIVTLISV